MLNLINSIAGPDEEAQIAYKIIQTLPPDLPFHLSNQLTCKRIIIYSEMPIDHPKVIYFFTRLMKFSINLQPPSYYTLEKLIEIYKTNPNS